MHPTHTTAPLRPPAELLRSAADYLERHGWTQGNHYGNPNGTGRPPACALGALIYEAAIFRRADHYPEIRAAGEALRAYLTGRLIDNGDYWRASEALANEITTWNDHPTRTGREVIATLRAAANQLDQLGGDRP